MSTLNIALRCIGQGAIAVTVLVMCLCTTAQGLAAEERPNALAMTGDPYAALRAGGQMYVANFGDIAECGHFNSDDSQRGGVAEDP